jgi:hypothetical protein
MALARMRMRVAEPPSVQQLLEHKPGAAYGIRGPYMMGRPVTLSSDGDWRQLSDHFERHAVADHTPRAKSPLRARTICSSIVEPTFRELYSPVRFLVYLHPRPD